MKLNKNFKYDLETLMLLIIWCATFVALPFLAK
nr:MAG TPA: hypothetical protein [Caudoviricetes sp.]